MVRVYMDIGSTETLPFKNPDLMEPLRPLVCEALQSEILCRVDTRLLI